jgi:hypothetical protein
MKLSRSVSCSDSLDGLAGEFGKQDLVQTLLGVIQDDVVGMDLDVRRLTLRAAERADGS